MPAPKDVLALVEKFDRHRESYESAAYNETQLRREFLDPMFAAMGWDVQNVDGTAEAYKEVIHEDAIKVGEFTNLSQDQEGCAAVRPHSERRQEGSWRRSSGRPYYGPRATGAPACAEGRTCDD